VSVAAVMLGAAGLVFGPAFARGMFLVSELAAAAKSAGLARSFTRPAFATGIGFLARLASAGIAFVVCHIRTLGPISSEFH
jgi:hypothetical protein